MAESEPEKGALDSAVTALLIAVFGALSFNYCLWNIFGKDIPWYGDLMCGVFSARVTVPLSIILWILKICGVVMPLFH